MDGALAFVDLSKAYGHVTAVDRVSLAVAPGEMVGLVGPDGAGKTTLARLAAGVLSPSSGRVEPEARGRVGYLSGRFSLYPELTVWENLTFFARMYGMKEVAGEATRLLDWVGLRRFRDRVSGALSGGMRQKLALCCAVIHRPPVLILDEPTTAVDPIARGDFWTLLREQAEQGRAVLVATPYLDEAEHCHRVGLLDRGRLLAVGRAAELRGRLPYRMALLRPDGQAWRRSETIAAAEGLPGSCWVQPLGTGVRVALEPGAPFHAPPGYRLEETAASLEDAYIWLSGALEVKAP